MTTPPKDRPWKDANFYLPQAAHLPVEVQLANGRQEIRRTLEGNWHEVTKWRSIQ